MAYRDILFVPLTSVFLLGDLAVPGQLGSQAALASVLRARRSARRPWPGSALWGSRRTDEQAVALVEQNVHHEPDSLTDAELIEAALQHGLNGLPVALTTTPTRCAIAMAHAVFDGSGALDLTHDLLDAVAGVPLSHDPNPIRLPVLRALRKVKPADVRSFVGARRHRPATTGSGGVLPARAAAAATTAAFSLSFADLTAVRRYREPDRAGRPTLHSRLASLTVAALREVATSELDIPIWITSDIRHLADGPVDGNFITRELIGTLQGDQWAPGALAARLVRLKGAGQALGLVWGTTGWLLRRALRQKPAPGEEIVLTFATTQRALSVPVGTVTATSMGGSPTFAFVWQTRDAVYLSVYNSTGRFDLARFEAVFRRIVLERASS